MGEMENSCIVSHGMGSTLKEFFVNNSDPYIIHVCSTCGMIAKKKPDKDIYLCQVCNIKGDSYTTHKVELPYAMKLMMQELQAINILPKIKVKTDIWNVDPSVHK